MATQNLGNLIMNPAGVQGSRYATGQQAAAAPADSSTASSGSSNTSSSGSSSTSGSSTTNSSSTQRNLSTQNEAILNQLIQQLLNGGTPEMKRQQGVRDAEANTVRGIRSDYSKENAFGDAQGLIAQQMRRALESMLPSINRAAEDAGSSGGALRALLLQDAANKAAESSSALGVNTAVQYGGIATNLSQVLEQFTRTDPSAVNGLIGALNAAKGATVSTSGSSTTTDNKTTTENKSTNTNEAKNTNTDYAPFAVTSGNSMGSTAPLYYGPQDSGNNAGKYVGTTLDTLSQLAGLGNPWASYNI